MVEGELWVRVGEGIELSVNDVCGLEPLALRHFNEERDPRAEGRESVAAG